MATKVLAPRLGEGVNELTIVRWLKQEGEPVKELESLLEVETDKVITEIPSPVTGTLLKRLVNENDSTGVGSVIAWIGQPGERLEGDTSAGKASFTANSQKETEIPRETPGEASQMERRNGSKSAIISPVVAKIARENTVDLSQVTGTGLGGRITKKDMLAYLETGTRSIPAMEHRAEAQAVPVLVGDRVVPHSVIRRSIAEHMMLSKQTSPHVLTVMEADLSRVAAHRASNKEAFAREGINLTYTPYFISAIISGLRIHPMVNSSWNEAGLVIHSAYNIGMATSLGEEGLIVPVIKEADRLSLSGLAKAVNDLAARARSKKLQPEDVKGGTFTLTNHGISGSLLAMPIINQPQCGILGVGAIQKRPVVITDEAGNDSIGIRPMVYLSFVFDHRILDGALADMFLSKVVETLEHWS